MSFCVLLGIVLLNIQICTVYKRQGSRSNHGNGFGFTLHVIPVIMIIVCIALCILLLSKHGLVVQHVQDGVFLTWMWSFRFHCECINKRWREKSMSLVRREWESVYLTSLLNSQGVMSDGPGTGQWDEGRKGPRHECTGFQTRDPVVWSRVFLTKPCFIMFISLRKKEYDKCW